MTLFWYKSGDVVITSCSAAFCLQRSPFSGQWRHHRIDLHFTLLCDYLTQWLRGITPVGWLQLSPVLRREVITVSLGQFKSAFERGCCVGTWILKLVCWQRNIKKEKENILATSSSFTSAIRRMYGSVFINFISHLQARMTWDHLKRHFICSAVFVSEASLVKWKRH